MRILVDVGHPAHVHFYKHAIWRWEDEGHAVLITARDKDVALDLLDHYGFSYRVLSSAARSQRGLYAEYLSREWALIRFMRGARPDVVTAIGGVFIAPAARLLGIPSVVFTDTEHVAADRYLTYPLATQIVTPSCFGKVLGSKQVRYDGYQELAYLHPDYFSPDRNIVADLGIGPNEPYAVIRFVGWNASHDTGLSGLSFVAKREIVQAISGTCRVLITSEAALPSEFEPYRIAAAPHNIHHLLAFACLYVGEGATMASETAILGTPAIYVNPLSAGTLIELSERYRLMHTFPGMPGVVECIERLLHHPQQKREWVRRRDAMLAEKIDVTRFICEQVESYLRPVDTGAGNAYKRVYPIDSSRVDS